MKTLFLYTILLAALTGCSSGPKLVHNEKYNQVGETTAQKDVDSCMRKADDQLDGSKSTLPPGSVRGSAGNTPSLTEEKRDLVKKCLNDMGYELKNWG